MRGEVLHYDEIQGFGFIAGDDGARYAFALEDLRRGASARKGALVEFRQSGGRARDVVDIRPDTASPPPAPGEISAAGGAPTVARPQGSPDFGRSAVSKRRDTIGLWSYFWRGLTGNYADFRGRARRKEYWGYFLFWLIALLAVIAAGWAADAAMMHLDDAPYITIALTCLFVLATLVPGIAMTVRRQHDIGLSGWFFLLIFVPYIGNLVILVFSLIPTQKRDNRWGPVPPGIDIPPPFMPAQPEIA